MAYVFLKTMKNEMIYVWDLIQNDPTESGTRNGWSLSKIRSALSQGLCGPGDGCLGMQVGVGNYYPLYLSVYISIILIIKRN